MDHYVGLPRVMCWGRVAGRGEVVSKTCW